MFPAPPFMHELYTSGTLQRGDTNISDSNKQIPATLSQSILEPTNRVMI